MKRCECHTGTILCAECGGVVAVARRRPRKNLAPGKSKAERTAERNARAAVIRDAVFARAERERSGRCECCNSRRAIEWHHLISAGSRRAMESAETTAAVCDFCHVDLHRNKFHALASMRRWAIEHRFTPAQKAIEHRMDKLSEARAQHPEHERTGTR